MFRRRVREMRGCSEGSVILSRMICIIFRFPKFFNKAGVRIQNPEGIRLKPASTDFLLFWLLTSGFCILLFHCLPHFLQIFYAPEGRDAERGNTPFGIRLVNGWPLVFPSQRVIEFVEAEAPSAQGNQFPSVRQRVNAAIVYLIYLHLTHPSFHPLSLWRRVFRLKY